MLSEVPLDGCLVLSIYSSLCQTAAAWWKFRGDAMALRLKSTVAAILDVENMLIGHGYDVHAFGPGDHLMIGGQRLPYEKAFVAHSDGDVLIHALCDALLGAAGLGDIGHHFPDTDDEWKGADSRDLLTRVLASLAEQKLTPHNADMTIVAQAPKMAPHIAAMRETLAADLGLTVQRVNVKATTSESLGFTGRHEGIAAHAVVTLREGD